MTEEDASTTAAAAANTVSSSKLKALARRRRILAKGKERMSIANGEVVAGSSSGSGAAADSSSSSSSPTSPLSSSSSPKADEVVTKTTTKIDSEKSTATASEEDVVSGTTSTGTTSTSSGAARLAQIRRRRYNKKKLAEAELEAKVEKNDVEKKDSPDLSKTSTSVDTVVETKDPLLDNIDKGKVGESDGKVPVSSLDDVNTSPTTDKEEGKFTTDSTDGKVVVDKKKYLGVAKMRRMKLAEQKAAAAAKSGGTNKDQSNTPVAGSSSSTPTLSLASRKTPIIFQLLTISCLFLCGFDVGMQNRPTDEMDTLVHRNFAPAQRIIGWRTKTDHDQDASDGDISSKSRKKNPGQATLISEGDERQQDIGSGEGGEEDEFGSGGQSSPVGADEISSTDGSSFDNIDPIFRVDLDEFTQGSGFLLAAARLAVRCHRLLVHLCLTLPMKTIRSVLSIPLNFLSNPPVLFLAALFIRYVGGTVLGGKTSGNDGGRPSVVDGVEGEDVGKTKGGSGGLPDIMGIGKGMVKGYVRKNFPSVVLLFSVLTEAKNDMMIVLCGMMLGLAIPASRSFTVDNSFTGAGRGETVGEL